MCANQVFHVIVGIKCEGYKVGRCKASATAGCVTYQENLLLLILKNSETAQLFAQVAQEHSCVCSCRLLGVTWMSWILFLSVYHIRVNPVLFEKTEGCYFCFGFCFLRQNQASWKMATNWKAYLV